MTTTRVFGFLTILLASCHSFSSESVEKQLSSKNGVERYVLHHADSNLKTFKASRIVKLMDPYALMAVMEDRENYYKWMRMVSDIEQFEEVSRTERHIRMLNNLPWPLKDREVVAVVKMLPQRNEKDYRLSITSNNDLLPPPPDDIVRIPRFEGMVTMELLENMEARITFQATVDPGGWIPKWIAHIMMSDLPYTTLISLERMLLQPEYQGLGENFPNLSFPEKW